MQVLAGIFRKDTSEVREEQPKPGKVIEVKGYNSKIVSAGKDGGQMI